MTNSEILQLFADANRKCGYIGYANFLEQEATVKAAEEITKEKRHDRT